MSVGEICPMLNIINRFGHKALRVFILGALLRNGENTGSTTLLYKLLLITEASTLNMGLWTLIYNFIKNKVKEKKNEDYFNKFSFRNNKTM